jgi:Na+/H+ antiporter NhaD/arsenite permease-like protein
MPNNRVQRDRKKRSAFLIKENHLSFFSRFFPVITPLLFPASSFASERSLERLDLTQHAVGFIALFVFVIAYALVILEEQLHLNKSKPVLMAAGIIWLMIGVVYQSHGIDEAAAVALRHNFLEFSELFFFLLVAMTYINAVLERGVFDALRDWLVGKGFSFRMLFWITGILAFFISPVADNLTTALIMCAVVMAVGSDNPRFVSLCCINIVVAANAGGAFSPFGDITTLMVWQRGVIEFGTFFKLFIPAVVNFLIPAAIMHAFIGAGKPTGDPGQSH